MSPTWSVTHPKKVYVASSWICLLWRGQLEYASVCIHDMRVSLRGRAPPLPLERTLANPEGGLLLWVGAHTALLSSSSLPELASLHGPLLAELRVGLCGQQHEVCWYTGRKNAASRRLLTAHVWVPRGVTREHLGQSQAPMDEAACLGGSDKRRWELWFWRGPSVLRVSSQHPQRGKKPMFPEVFSDGPTLSFGN